MAALTRFRAVANSVLENGGSDESAMQAGWGAVKEDWEKGPDGKWVAKIGARNSTLDTRRIQLIHDTAIELGAVCHTPECGIGKAAEKTLYVSRTLLNTDPFIAWAKSQGFATTLPPGELHVTIAYAKTPMLWPEPIADTLTISSKEGRKVTPLGDGGAVVLKFKSSQLVARWDYLRSIGASWNHDQYQPHVSISWDAADVNLDDVAVYNGELIFGPEIFQEVKENWADSVTEKVGKEKVLKAEVKKVDEELGIVFGWAIISNIEGKPYVDTQGDHIPENAMLKAAARFMEGSRVAGNMHRQISPIGDRVERIGTVIFSFPLTTEISKKMGIKTKQTGLMLGMKVDSAAILEKFKSGEYTGFSIGGRRIKDKEVAYG